jgi:hypothetical protein
MVGKRTPCQALPGAFFLFWQKEVKTIGRIATLKN